MKRGRALGPEMNQNGIQLFLMIFERPLTNSIVQPLIPSPYQTRRPRMTEFDLCIVFGRNCIFLAEKP